MKTKTLSVVLLCLVYANSVVGQTRINHLHFIKLFNDRSYSNLYRETFHIRTSEEYGKNWMIDYFMSMALCGLGQKVLAEKGFSYIEHEYALQAPQKELIKLGRQFCGYKESSYTPNLLLAYVAFNNSNAPNNPISIVSGKLGQILDCRKNLEQYKFDPTFDQTKLQDRLFSVQEKDSALESYKLFLPEKIYNINSFGRYIIVTKAPDNLEKRDVEEAAMELEKVYQFMVNRYNVRAPNYLITIYLMGNLGNLAQAAKDVHGLTIPSRSYGYSCIADLSVLGNSSKNGLGTIKHELFHLIIRTDIGDIPGWLDEGVASLYEESHWEGDSLKHDKNLWRTKVLKQNSDVHKPLPLLRTIINNNWNEFTPNESTTPCELAVNYALAKHFAMFLEDKGQLSTVLDAFKNRKNIFVDTTSVSLNSVQILEQALDYQLNDIQTEFDRWLSDKFGISTHRDKSSILEHMDHLEVLEYICYNKPEVDSIKQEYMRLINNVRNSNTIVPDDLLEKCIKLIAKAEQMYLDCSGE